MFPALLPTYNRTDIAFVRGEGSYLFAEDGKRYLDFGAGIAVNAFGHAHPRMLKALTEQAKELGTAAQHAAKEATKSGKGLSAAE